MGEKIVVGPINKGLRTGVTPFNIDNDSFPTLINAFQWRGRVKRKRGTSLLGRLTRFFDSTSLSYSATATITLNGAGVGNILTGFGLQANGNIIPGSVEITAPGPTVYTDPAMDGTLAPSGSINYATGVITILAEAGNAVSVNFLYYPNLPVMGLKDLILGVNQFPRTLGFDTKYSYNILTSDPYDIYDVSFYKNPPVDPVLLPGYVPKTVVTPTSWNGQDYQQFWTVNYQNAFWATNGISVPFTTTNVGMQFKVITGITTTAGAPIPVGGVGTPAIVRITIAGHGLIVGDFIFVNEVEGTTGINWQTGYVINVVDPNIIDVEFPFADIRGAYVSGGIAQYLTNRSDVTKDCIRWYDGDPTDGNVTNPTLNGNRGWVNFMPPLSLDNFSIADLPPRIYYLVGARMLLPFKDSLLAFGPVVQASTGAPIYLQDTIVYSQNGTPYYTVSYTNAPNPAVDTPTNPPLTPPGFVPMLLPINQTATPSAWFEDQTGFGGFISAGIDQPIVTAFPNEDVLIVGFDRLQTKLVYTGNDIIPFNFFIINSELGSSSTFSGIVMDKGVITRGNRGIVITNQVEAARIDLEIPDQVFQFNLKDNGTERVTAQRDFINEWVYITYLSNQVTYYKFPNQTLLYNYRDSSWAIFNEAYTTYGQFRRISGFIWSTVGRTYPTWQDWNEAWNAGNSTLLQTQMIAGNQQGFVIFRDQGTGEATSLYIQGFSGNVVTSPDHCLNSGDFIIITGIIGTLGAQINGRIFSVASPTKDTFELNPAIGTGTYVGGGVIKRMYVPFIQTKQFPVSWGMARKTRLGPQQYLFSYTDNAQITLLIFLSQDNSFPYNDSLIVPAVGAVNDSLIYSTVLYTCPESTNLGLTPANTNLQMVTANNQDQIWHRMNTSLLGDTVQIGFTLSETQMRSLTATSNAHTITGITLGSPTVLTTTGEFNPGLLIEITGVVGTTELNGNIYYVISSTPTTVTIEVDSTGFTPYVSGGFATPMSPDNQFAEIELHGMILDVNQSMVLA